MGGLDAPMRWVPELPLARDILPEEALEWLIRSYRSISDWSQKVQNEINQLAGTITYGAQITFNAGDGTPHGDLNATDFTGHPYASPTIPTALFIESNHIVTFGHNAIAYLWTGPTNVTVGIGGSYTAISTDLTPIGTADHTILVNRSNADQHPTAAITGLDAKQASQDSNISANTGLINTHKATNNQDHQITHDMLVGQSPEPDPHPVYSKKLPGMAMFGDADDFTLNTTQSKLVNYEVAAQWNWTDQNDVDPANGEITIPQEGIYTVTGTLIGNQGNTNKEEWMEMRLVITGGNPSAGTYTVAEREIPTDKTSLRSLLSTFTRRLYTGDVLSLWIWGSTGLGTFSVDGTTFEVIQISEISGLTP